MKHPKLILRLLHINWVLVTHGLDDLILKTHLFRPLRFLAIFSPNFWRKKDFEARGVRIRRTLEDLGPIYVKFGQALSTRKDILADDIADELVKLQDKVPPFSDQQAREVIEKELGMPIEEAFAEFSASPLASASVAQVHAAVLHSGEEVVVKVLRPDVEKWIHSDIGLLYELAYFAEKFWDDAKRLHAKEIVAEFEKTLLDELDLVREAGNAAKLRRNFENSEAIYIPEI
ncbi:MAG: ubiquinone biosynthesis regulatory protein kinase UbiB, partial [Methyloprofundus sp.]|nr:ubiquinone biosynthesis regulatory protein kinase UbiB [Methyloprofundus sp.]